MQPFVVLALGLPEYYELLMPAAALAGVVSLGVGFAVSTYARAIVAGLVLGLGWIALSLVYGVPPAKQLLFVAACVIAAAAAQGLRRVMRSRRTNPRH